MLFARPFEKNLYSNDPKGFKYPWTTPSQLEEEKLKWKYFRLSNYPTRPQFVRCNNFLYGECERRAIGLRL
jgi:hypothetical protein